MDQETPPVPERSPAIPMPSTEPDFRLRVEGFKGTPEEIERQWFEQVYTGRGDRMTQLTWRAVLMGSVLGVYGG